MKKSTIRKVDPAVAKVLIEARDCYAMLNTEFENALRLAPPDLEYIGAILEMIHQLEEDAPWLKPVL